MRKLLLVSVALAALVAQAPLATARGAKVHPKKVLGAAWSLLGKATAVEVALIERKEGGKLGPLHGLAATSRAQANKRWLRDLRALLRNPRSYYKPRCDKSGRCPQLRCRTTPRAVITLARGDESAVVVLTVCFALRAGASLSALAPQISFEPGERRMLALLRRLFPKDAALKERQREARKLRRR